MRIDGWALLVAAAFSAAPAGAEIVDRIVAVVDREAITLSEAEAAQNVQRLKGTPVAPLPEVVERLIESRLVWREVERYPDAAATPGEVDGALTELRRALGGEGAYRNALREARTSEPELRRDLARQITITRYAERRFRIQVQVGAPEVRRYYEEEILPELAKGGKAAPPLESIDSDIRAILEETLFSKKVAEWIDQLKTQAKVRRHVW